MRIVTCSFGLYVLIVESEGESLCAMHEAANDAYVLANAQMMRAVSSKTIMPCCCCSMSPLTPTNGKSEHHNRENRGSLSWNRCKRMRCKTKINTDVSN